MLETPELNRPSWYDEQAVSRDQLREDSSRSMAANLAEGLALSEFLSAHPGAQYLSVPETRSLFRAAQIASASED